MNYQKFLINNIMEWIKCDDLTKEIPFTKVCIWDGGNTFWAYLYKIETTKGGRKLFWEISTPEGYPYLEPLYWMKITEPVR